MLLPRASCVLRSIGNKSRNKICILFTSLPILERHCSYSVCNQYSKYKRLKSDSGRDKFNNVPVRNLRTNIFTSENTVLSPYEDVLVPNQLLHELIWKDVEKWPDHIGIECGITKRNYTFAQLRKYSKQFAASLLKSGIRPGEVLSLVMPNLPEYVIVLLGASESGVILSPVNPAYTADEICHQLTNSKSVGVITYADKLNSVTEAVSKYQQHCQSSKPIKIISMQNFDGVSREHPAGVWSLQEMFQNDIDTSIVDIENRNQSRDSNDVFVLPYSSGTTGLPKGVCLTHHNIVSNVQVIAAKGTNMNLEPQGDFQDVVVSVLPFFHIYALVIILLEALKHGGKTISLPKFDPQQYIKTLKEYNSTILYAVPPLVSFLSSHQDVSQSMFERTRHIMCAAAPIGLTDIEKCLLRFPRDTVFKQGYGLTETSPIVVLCPNDNKKLTSVGPPASLTEMKVIDPNNGKNLGVGEDGEICVFGPQVMKCYLNNPDATASTIDKDGWFHTGDIGHYDESGYFYIVDRIKELIKVKGFQVAPAELEELLRCHPLVDDAAVIGAPHVKAGETPVAYVVKKKGQDMSKEEIIKYVAEKVTKYKHISDVIFTDAIPKNPSGKILRRRLRDLYVNSS